MKIICLFILFIVLAACNKHSDQAVVIKNQRSVHIDSFYIDSAEFYGSCGEPYKELPCPRPE